MSDRRRKLIGSRDHRRLAGALRGAQRPVPPEGLRERLLAVAGPAPARAPSRRFVWGYAAIVAIAGVALAVCYVAPFASRSAPSRTGAVARQTVFVPNQVANRITPERRIAGAQKTQAGPPPASEKRPATRVALRGADSRGLRRTEDAVAPGTMTVAVGRAGATTVGVATASAMLPDGAGGWTKTEFTMVRDPRSHIAHQKATYTDAADKRRKLTVASASVGRNEEEERP